MKSPFSLACCTVGLLCFALSAPLAVANPLKSIGSSLKKAGNALNPFKKSEAKPAPVAPPPAPAAKPKAKAKPKPVVAKTTKPAPAKKKKPAAAAPPKSTPVEDASKAAAAAGAAAAVGSTEAPPEAGATPANTTDTPPAPAEAAPVPPAAIPFGIPVMGRKGYVRSPFAEDQGMVDVNDIPAGAKVKCPFTGKIFRVP